MNLMDGIAQGVPSSNRFAEFELVDQHRVQSRASCGKRAGHG
jgi:hypothetical protein